MAALNELIVVHSSSTRSLDGVPGTFGLKFQSEGGFERDATFFHRETSPALISDFMAKLRPRLSIRRPKEGGAGALLLSLVRPLSRFS